MKNAERQLLVDLRRALLTLHKTLLDWERVAYDRVHGRRTSPGELLNVVMTDPQVAWLRPLSELIVRIDEALDMEAPDTVTDVDSIVGHARSLVAPSEGAGWYAERYRDVLQEHPDAVLAHRDVTTVLKGAPTTPETLH
jgi:hypothetical protein